MPILLKTEEYCKDCPRFEPECRKMYYDGNVVTTEIFCENRQVCKWLAEYLKKKGEKDNGCEMR